MQYILQKIQLIILVPTNQCTIPMSDPLYMKWDMITYYLDQQSR
ncbi:hypothetical protein [Myroides odoratimimus]|nr:hypothetical protein [Myroides odoratimimus]